MILKFRRRLTVAVVAVTTLALGGGFAVVALAVNASQESQMDTALLVEAHQEAAEAAALGGATLNISDRPGPAPDDIGHLTKYAAIYGSGGELLAATETFHGEAPSKDSIHQPEGRCFNTWFGREHLRAVLVPIPRRPAALLLLAAPRFDSDRDAAFLNRATLLVLLLVVLWAGAVTTWVVNRFTRGHEVIASVARRVAAGDLSARIDTRASANEMIQLGDDVNQMIEQLSLLVSSRQEFIAHAAHELRSPLTTLYGELSHARRRSRDTDEYEKAIDEALDSTRRLKVLAEDLLTLARVTASPGEPREVVSPRAVVENAARTVAAEAATLEVTVSLHGESGDISGRRQDLERLFRNLLENAIRHSPRGGVVEARVADQGGASVVVTVDDEGVGVADGDRERIFESFYRGPRESADELPGVGLGLAIARKVARAHGGDVTLGPARDRGAQFVVRLPSAGASPARG